MEIKKIIDYVRKNGGCTLDNAGNIADIAKGYTISLQRFEFKTTLGNVTEIKKDIEKKLEVAQSKKNLLVGLWLDNDILYIDLNKIELNYTRAMEFAKNQQQLAIFDNINKKSIYLKKDTCYILYEYIEKSDDIQYITEFTSKKELCKFTGFYEFRNLQRYIYNEFAKITDYFIKNNKKYIIIREEA